MKVLEVSKQNALRAYNKADAKGKSLLGDLYGQEVFTNQDITDRIQSVEDAFKETGRPILDFSMYPKDMQEYQKANYEAMVIIEAYNEGWIPNWADGNERKWSLWFDMSPFAFNRSSNVCACTYAGCGSRLRLKEERLAIDMAKKFPKLWEIIQLK